MLASICFPTVRHRGRTVKRRASFLVACAPVVLMMTLSQAQAEPQTLFYGGDILTMADEKADRRKTVKALIVRNGEISEIFKSDEDYQTYLSDSAVTKVNLGGATLMPGFIEPHMHMPLVVNYAAVADLSPCLPEPYSYRTYDNQVDPRFKDKTVCKYDGSIETGFEWTWNVLNSATNRWVPFAPDGMPTKQAWIVGNGIDPSRFGVTPDEIQRVATFRSHPAEEISKSVEGADAHPVLILDQSGHVAYVNGNAFVAANICTAWPCGPEINRNKDMPAPDPLGKWEVYTGQDGNAYYSGLLQEEAAYRPFVAKIQEMAGVPASSPFFFMDYEEGLKAVAPVVEKIAAAGVTTIVNGGGFTVPIIQFNKDVALHKDEAGNFTAPFRIRTLISATAIDPSEHSKTAVEIAEAEMTSLWPNEVLSKTTLIKNTQGRYGATGIKFWADGSTQGCSAYLTQGYNINGICVDEENGKKTAVTGSHGANYQFFMPDNDEEPDLSKIAGGDGSFLAALQPFWSKGWPIQIHTNGDKAIKAVAITTLGLSTGRCNEYPVTLIHATVGGDPATSPSSVAQYLWELTKVARRVHCKNEGGLPLNFIVSHLTGHVGYWGGGFVSLLDGKDLNNLGADGDPNGRAPTLDATTLDVRDNIPFTLHSDAPIAPVNPLWYVEQMVTRNTWVYPDIKGSQVKDMPDSKWAGNRDGRSIYENLKGITAVAAEQTLIDDKVGTLEQGKVADLVILDRNPLDADSDVNSSVAINKIKVCYTYLAGKRWKPKSFSDEACGKIEITD
ncbi:amidohydrolase family protein [Pseudovibrio sp. Alg231-02]|uniref:amidohydrolase family protein n=1 Tax=Pseudovibrio sp. Alg231-02 TaxID=1922223 RepID=UPI00131F2C13|nr:amidohydrolase family protein [Pseudovibrio sp. Alg231-02]